MKISAVLEVMLLQLCLIVQAKSIYPKNLNIPKRSLKDRLQDFNPLVNYGKRSGLQKNSGLTEGYGVPSGGLQLSDFFQKSYKQRYPGYNFRSSLLGDIDSEGKEFPALDDEDWRYADENGADDMTSEESIGPLASYAKLRALEKRYEELYRLFQQTLAEADQKRR